MAWDDPEIIRTVARQRATDLQNARASYQKSLAHALEQLEEAASAYNEARTLVRELRAKLAPLADEIAHLEACARTEVPTLDMLVWTPPD